VLVNVFGGITSCDEVANGIVSALAMLSGGGRRAGAGAERGDGIEPARGREGHSARGEQVTRPIVVRLDGNNAAEGRAILDRAGLAVVERNDTMDGAARRAAELAASPQTATGA